MADAAKAWDGVVTTFAHDPKVVGLAVKLLARLEKEGPAVYVMGSDRVCHGRWLFNQIRGYSIDGETLAFESGRRAVNGEGHYAIKSFWAAEIYAYFDELEEMLTDAEVQYLTPGLPLSEFHKIANDYVLQTVGPNSPHLQPLKPGSKPPTPADKSATVYTAIDHKRTAALSSALRQHNATRGGDGGVGGAGAGAAKAAKGRVVHSQVASPLDDLYDLMAEVDAESVASNS